MEALPQTSEGDEGLGWETPGAHFTVGVLIPAGWAHTVEASNEQVHAGTPVFAYSAGTAARANVHLAIFPWRRKQRSHKGCPSILVLLFSTPWSHNKH